MSNGEKSSKRVALITGCSEPDSLGAALAVELVARGYRVFASARKVETLKGLAQAGCDILSLDVTGDESVRAAVASIKEQAGRLDILINNAGVWGQAPLLDTRLDLWRHSLEVNLVGHLRVTQACAELLVATAKAARLSGAATGKRALIVNIGAVAAKGKEFTGAYGAAKAALTTMPEALRIEVDPLGIDVSLVYLGVVNTAMTQKKKMSELSTAGTNSVFYPNFIAIMEVGAPKYSDMVAKAPSPRVVARELLDVTERPNARGRTPGRVTYAGWASALIGKWWPFLPQFLCDIIFKGNAELIIRP